MPKPFDLTRLMLDDDLWRLRSMIISGRAHLALPVRHNALLGTDDRNTMNISVVIVLTLAGL